MKRLLRFGVLGFIIVVLGVGAALLFGPDLSPDQLEIVDVLGYPDRFRISYLPARDDAETVVRTEVWFYPEHQRNITFAAGELVGLAEAEADEALLQTAWHEAVDATLEGSGTAPGEVLPTSRTGVSYRSLRPESFHLHMGFDDVVEAIGGADGLVSLELPAGLEDTGLEVWAGDGVAFGLQDDVLLYFETLATSPGVLELRFTIRPEGFAGAEDLVDPRHPRHFITVLSEPDFDALGLDWWSFRVSSEELRLQSASPETISQEDYDGDGRTDLRFPVDVQAVAGRAGEVTVLLQAEVRNSGARALASKRVPVRR